MYRASPSDGVAWITGASTGIGRALALELARDGYTVAATARGVEKLAALGTEAAGLPGRIVAFAGDVTDAEGMRQTVARIEAELGPIVLAVLNAGSYFPTRGDALDPGNFVRTYEINVFGVIYGLAPVVERMLARGHGHVAMVGSVSGYGGLPMAAAYGASKAAINNMAESLKFDFDKMNIRIQVINPGFIDTPLTKKNKFPMPALMDLDKATKRLAKGLKTGGFEVTFPRRFTWALKVVNLLPHSAYFAVMNRAMGGRKRPIRRLK
jgi:NAD(P)-dependent dehydrogenase (short-subunit alcohol dehydrogenase family)